MECILQSRCWSKWLNNIFKTVYADKWTAFGLIAHMHWDKHRPPASFCGSWRKTGQRSAVPPPYPRPSLELLDVIEDIRSYLSNSPKYAWCEILWGSAENVSINTDRFLLAAKQTYGKCWSTAVGWNKHCDWRWALLSEGMGGVH